MNGTQKGILVKLAGSIGVVGASLMALPSFAASPLNPNPKIFSEAPYNRLAQATPSMMTPATESVTTETTIRSSSPSLAKVNPNPSIFNEAPYNRLLSQSTGGANDRPAAPAAEPSNVGPTIQQSPGSSPTTPGTTETTPGSTTPGSSGDVTVPTSPSESTTPSSPGTTTPESTTTPSSPGTTTPESTTPSSPGTTTPESTTTPSSPGTTTPESTTTPDSTTPSEDSTTPSGDSSGGQSGGVRALW
ncbi:hypothetical protein ACKFKG_11135 [Phormidesmis sp. 146-35]